MRQGLTERPDESMGWRRRRRGIVIAGRVVTGRDRGVMIGASAGEVVIWRGGWGRRRGHNFWPAEGDLDPKLALGTA